jgi:putative intracellular protease/amidase
MKTAIVTFDAFNEIDSMLALYILNRVDLPGWRAEITGATKTITSMNGVVIDSQKPLEFAAEADAVIIGSGRRTREIADDDSLMSRLKLDPSRQLIASQCSGALVLIRLGLVQGVPVCTDRKTQRWVEAAGLKVLDEPFFARERVATAGGCLSAHYLATWLIWNVAGRQAAIDALSYVLPHGEEEEYMARALAQVEPFILGSGVSRQAQSGNL